MILFPSDGSSESAHKISQSGHRIFQSLFLSLKLTQFSKYFYHVLDEDFGSFLEPMKQKDQLILRSKMEEMNENDKVEEEDVDSGEERWLMNFLGIGPIFAET